jgi:hypothetical protein
MDKEELKVKLLANALIVSYLLAGTKFSSMAMMKERSRRDKKKRELLLKQYEQVEKDFDDYRKRVLQNRTMEFSKERAR